MPWYTAEVLSFFKKGDRNNIQNYRGITLFTAAYKTYSNIINNMLKIVIHLLLVEEQAGFRTGCSCTDNTFTLKQMKHKSREYNLETHIAIIDFQKAFDKIDRSTSPIQEGARKLY